MSVKKLNTTGSSSPSACCGGVSMHVPCIQRTNCLVLNNVIDLKLMKMIMLQVDMMILNDDDDDKDDSKMAKHYIKLR